MIQVTREQKYHCQMLCNMLIMIPIYTAVQKYHLRTHCNKQQRPNSADNYHNHGHCEL